MFLMPDYLYSVSLGLFLCFHDYFCWFLIFFLSTSQEIGCEEHLLNDLFCVEWNVKP